MTTPDENESLIDDELEQLAGEALRTRTSRTLGNTTLFDRVQRLERLFRSLAQVPGGPALIYRTKDGAIRAHVLSGEVTMIGRSSSCDLAFPDDTWMSRRHCAVCREEGGYVLRDLESKNGVFLECKVRVVERVLLSGDRFQVGDVTFSFVDAPMLEEPKNFPTPA